MILMPYVGYIFILLVCLGVILVAFNKVNEKLYPFVLYGIGAGMVLIFTLAGPYLVGSDIHLEYYYAQLHSGSKEVLQPAVTTPQGTSIASSVIAPLLPIPLLWTYKLVYPLLFSFIPIILYSIFKRWFTPTQAFLASFFFIAFPTFFMELPNIARQMTAEVVLVILLYLIFVSGLRTRYKTILVGLCGALLPLLHYSVALLAPILLSPIFISAWRRKRKSLRLLATPILVVIISMVIYFPLAEGGAVGIKLGHVYNSLVPGNLRTQLPELPTLPGPPLVTGPPIEPIIPVPPGDSTAAGIPPAPGTPFIKRYEILMRIGFGADFLTTTIPGKIFRVLQWGILLLMIVGLWKLRRNKEFLVLGIGGILLLVLCLVPGFSGFLNITRFFHISLFFLAPTIAVVLKPRYLLIILIPYFLFTSGFVFEVTKQPDIEQVTIPYSVGLSNYRIDLGATTTKDDIEIRRYIFENELFPIYSDINGANFMGEVLGWRDDLNGALERRKPTGYVFVRSRNIQDGTFTVWNGVGCRRYVEPEYYGIDWDKNIIYQKGDARVIWVIPEDKTLEGNTQFKIQEVIP